MHAPQLVGDRLRRPAEVSTQVLEADLRQPRVSVVVFVPYGKICVPDKDVDSVRAPRDGVWFPKNITAQRSPWLPFAAGLLVAGRP